MGCSTSTVSPGEEGKAKAITKDKNTFKDKKQIVANGHAEATTEWSKQTIDNNGNKLNSLSQTPVPKSVAFDVTLDGLDAALGGKKRPQKLQTLEPLSVPKLTAEQLQEKQRLADEKREKLKQRKISASQKSSRRRRQLLEAREFETKILNEQNKVKTMQNLDDDVEVDKDTEFHTADMWRGTPDRTHHLDDDEDLEYSPQKRVGGQERPAGSASTVDSYDAAFMRSSTKEIQKLQPIHNLGNNVHVMSDDFFDS
ncbi:unnamed protein product [Candidula unifasciata]|uniref:Uncharacterized protein n=1 Tax=Candidula unifasciata TaxID=100452 RepID=A0A8S3ZCU5_9EUPU|nr:unnamed protein product [Candidula unifasciata]